MNKNSSLRRERSPVKLEYSGTRKGRWQIVVEAEIEFQELFFCFVHSASSSPIVPHALVSFADPSHCFLLYCTSRSHINAKIGDYCWPHPTIWLEKSAGNMTISKTPQSQDGSNRFVLVATATSFVRCIEPPSLRPSFFLCSHVEIDSDQSLMYTV